MSHLGLGVMINMLLNEGEDSNNIIEQAVGKTITAVKLEENGESCQITFADGTGITFTDGVQSCCERRYMTTDDDLPYYSGAKFLGAEKRKAPAIEHEYGMHECEFLVILTDKGNISFVNHNEHNGYYGGFYVCAAPIVVGK